MERGQEWRPRRCCEEFCHRSWEGIQTSQGWRPGAQHEPKDRYLDGGLDGEGTCVWESTERAHSLSELVRALAAPENNEKSGPVHCAGCQASREDDMWGRGRGGSSTRQGVRTRNKTPAELIQPSENNPSPQDQAKRLLVRDGKKSTEKGRWKEADLDVLVQEDRVMEKSGPKRLRVSVLLCDSQEFVRLLLLPCLGCCFSFPAARMTYGVCLVEVGPGIVCVKFSGQRDWFSKTLSFGLTPPSQQQFIATPPRLKRKPHCIPK